MVVDRVIRQRVIVHFDDEALIGLHFVAGISQQCRSFSDITQRFHAILAYLQGGDSSNFKEALIHDLCGLAQQGDTILPGGQPPGFESCFGSSNGVIGILNGSGLELTEYLIRIGWINAFEFVFGETVFTVDEHAMFKPQITLQVFEGFFIASMKFLRGIEHSRVR